MSEIAAARGWLCRMDGVAGQFPARAQQQMRGRLDPAQTNQFASGMLLAFIKLIFPSAFRGSRSNRRPQ
jgi:hypothetical protein